MIRAYLSVVSLVVGVNFFMPEPVLARLGQEFYEFKYKQIDSFKLNKIVLKDDLKFCSFSLLLNQEELKKAPGFKGGMTVTVERGLIVSQSLALNIGKNRVAGTKLASQQAYQFACESLGRSEKSNDLKTNHEKALFARAIELAMRGKPQELKFPHVVGKLVFKKSKSGDLLIAAMR